MMCKSVLDFFHYARMSFEIITQILNAALFGEKAVPRGQRQFPIEVSKKIGQEPKFAILHNLITTGINDPEIKYLMAFDNFVKHVTNPSFLIKNGFLFSDEATFKIKAFENYAEVDAIDKIDSAFIAVNNYIENVLNELLNQMANGIGRSNRFHTVSIKVQLRQIEEKSYVDYVSFFIEVDHGIQDIPSKISVLPLTIDNEGNVIYKPFPIDKIFITLKEKEEQGICGVAELKAGQDSTALYQKFNVRGCTADEYRTYLTTFKDTYQKIRFPMGSPYNGKLVFYEDCGSEPSA